MEIQNFSHRSRAGPAVIKEIFMLNSAEHETNEIIYAHNYKKYQEIQIFFSGSDKPRMLFFLLLNVQMPTVVGIFSFMSRKKFMFS